MREGIHPTYYPDATVICGCGNTFTTGSTQKVIRTDVCSECHPFYTGEQRIVDTAGQVERFMRRIEVRQEKTRAQQAAAQARSEAERRSRDKARQERLRRAGLKRISEAMQSPGEGGEAVGEAVAAVEGPARVAEEPMEGGGKQAESGAKGREALKGGEGK